MFRKLFDFCDEYAGTIVFLIVAISVSVGVVWCVNRSTTYDFGNGTQLVVPLGAVSVDRRKDGYGIVVESGVNVTVHNKSDEWRSLTVSYRKPNYQLLDTHAFDDLPPKSSKTFGADASKYEGMHISVSDYAQRKRDKKIK